MNVDKNYPINVTVKWVEAFQSEDSKLGNTVFDYHDAVDINVFAYSIPKGEEVGFGDINREIYDVNLYFPSTYNIQAKDRIEIDNNINFNGVYDVVTPPANYDSNPWWMPGLSIAALKKVDG